MEHQKVHAEIDGEQQGKHRDDHLDHRAAVCPHTGVPVGEAAGPRGGKGVDEGVIQGHPRQLEEDHLQGGHGEVDGIQDLGGLRLLGDQLGKDRARALRLGQVVGGHPQRGKDRRGQHQHAHAAQPVGEGAPEQDPPGQRLNIHQDGGACGGEAGAGLKNTVHKGLKIPGEVEGQSPHHPGDQPDQPHGDKALPEEEMLFRAHGGQGQTDGQDDQDAQQEGRRALPVQQGDRHGEEQGKRLGRHHPSHQPQNKLNVHCFLPGRGRRPHPHRCRSGPGSADLGRSGSPNPPPGYWRTPPG